MVTDAAFTYIVKFLLLNIVKLNSQTAVLTRLLRERGVSAEQLKEADAWANSQLAPAFQAVDSIQNISDDQSLSEFLRAFSGPIQ